MAAAKLTGFKKFLTNFMAGTTALGGVMFGAPDFSKAQAQTGSASTLSTPVYGPMGKIPVPGVKPAVPPSTEVAQGPIDLTGGKAPHAGTVTEPAKPATGTAAPAAADDRNIFDRAWDSLFGSDTKPAATTTPAATATTGTPAAAKPATAAPAATNAKGATWEQVTASFNDTANKFDAIADQAFDALLKERDQAQKKLGAATAQLVTAQAQAKTDKAEIERLTAEARASAADYAKAQAALTEAAKFKPENEALQKKNKTLSGLVSTFRNALWGAGIAIAALVAGLVYAIVGKNKKNETVTTSEEVVGDEPKKKKGFWPFGKDKMPVKAPTFEASNDMMKAGKKLTADQMDLVDTIADSHKKDGQDVILNVDQSPNGKEYKYTSPDGTPVVTVRSNAVVAESEDGLELSLKMAAAHLGGVINGKAADAEQNAQIETLLAKMLRDGELVGKDGKTPLTEVTFNGKVITPAAVEAVTPEAKPEPEVVQPEAVKPETKAEPEVVQPEAVKPETMVEPEAVQTEAVKPETVIEPEAVQPEAVKTGEKGQTPASVTLDLDPSEFKVVDETVTKANDGVKEPKPTVEAPVESKTEAPVSPEAEAAGDEAAWITITKNMTERQMASLAKALISEGTGYGLRFAKGVDSVAVHALFAKVGEELTKPVVAEAAAPVVAAEAAPAETVEPKVVAKETVDVIVTSDASAEQIKVAAQEVESAIKAGKRPVIKGGLGDEQYSALYEAVKEIRAEEAARAESVKPVVVEVEAPAVEVAVAPVVEVVKSGRKRSRSRSKSADNDKTVVAGQTVAASVEPGVAQDHDGVGPARPAREAAFEQQLNQWRGGYTLDR